MKKKRAEMIARLWNEQFAGSTKPTKTKAVVEKYLDDYIVDIVPDGGDNLTFHHVEEFADVCRTFKVSGYITFDVDERSFHASMF